MRHWVMSVPKRLDTFSNRCIAAIDVTSTALTELMLTMLPRKAEPLMPVRASALSHLIKTSTAAEPSLLASVEDVGVALRA